MYRVVINYFGYKVYFANVTDTNMKQLENIEETEQVFVGNIYCNISAASGALIAVKKKTFQSGKL
jgi:hypothetical protein